MEGKGGEAWTAQNSISLTAAVLSLCALAITVQQGCAIREFWRISLRPVLSIDFYHDAEGARYTISNVGLGPAIVKWFDASVDGKSQRSWRDVVDALGLPHERYSYTYSHRQTVFKKDGSSILFAFGAGPAAQLLDRENKLRLTVCFCSFYGECWLESNGSIVESHPDGREQLVTSPGPEPTTSCDAAPDVIFGRGDRR